jgi:hypothetical protein
VRDQQLLQLHEPAQAARQSHNLSPHHVKPVKTQRERERVQLGHVSTWLPVRSSLTSLVQLSKKPGGMAEMALLLQSNERSWVSWAISSGRLRILLAER